MVKLLRAEGMKRTEAVEEAWQRLAVEYPPLPHTAEPEPEPEHGDDEAEEKAAGRVVGPTTLPAAWANCPSRPPSRSRSNGYTKTAFSWSRNEPAGRLGSIGSVPASRPRAMEPST